MLRRHECLSGYRKEICASTPKFSVLGATEHLQSGDGPPLFAACYVVSLSLLSGCFDTPPLDPMAQGEELVVVTRNTPTTYYFRGRSALGF